MGSNRLKIACTSASFSQNSALASEVKELFPKFVLNTRGAKLHGENLVRFLSDADVAIIGLEKVDDNVLRSCPKLKFIAKYGVGLDNIDLNACDRHGVQIGWTGGVNALSVAEMALGFMLMLSRNLFCTSVSLKNGRWQKKGGGQLSEKTIGIIGIGAVGKQLIKLLQPMNCKILVNDTRDQEEFYKDYGLSSTSKDFLIRHSDFISVHTPLTDETRNMFNRAAFQEMKDSAFLINTARGGIINQQDLKAALKTQVIAGAAIDVYESEPPLDYDFLNLPNLICTPHIGGNASEAVKAMGYSAISHLKEYLKIRKD